MVAEHNARWVSGGDTDIVSCVVRQFDDPEPRRWSGVTELPRLTSDSIVYGGPQGWNPHFLRTRTFASTGLKPIEPRSRPEIAARFERPANHVESFFASRFKAPRLLKGVEPRSSFGGKTPEGSFTSNPRTRLHLRASDWARDERPKPQDAADTQSERPHTLKGTGLVAFRPPRTVGASFASPSSPFVYLRASNRTRSERPESRDAVDVRFVRLRSFKSVGLELTRRVAETPVGRRFSPPPGGPNRRASIAFYRNSWFVHKAIGPNRVRGGMTWH